MRSMARCALPGVLVGALLLVCARGAAAAGIGANCTNNNLCDTCTCVNGKCATNTRCAGVEGVDCETCQSFFNQNNRLRWQCGGSPALLGKPCISDVGGCRQCAITPNNAARSRCQGGGGSAGNCPAPYLCNQTLNNGGGLCFIPGGQADPELTGFDGVTRWFTELGDFVILKEFGGMEVAATFVSEQPVGGFIKKDYSWTQTIRVTSPEGEVLSCHLSSTLLGSDTQHIQVTATDSDGNKFNLEKMEGSNTTQTVRFQSMFVKGVVKGGRLVGCQARSERLNVYAVQMFGPDQAVKDKTGSHDWAKPFTWLNFAFEVPKALKTPVTGLIGRTYPLNKVQTSRRLMSVTDGSLLIAGSTAGLGETLAEVMQP